MNDLIELITTLTETDDDVAYAAASAALLMHILESLDKDKFETFYKDYNELDENGAHIIKGLLSYSVVEFWKMMGLEIPKDDEDLIVC